jgi:hypothetical protein
VQLERELNAEVQKERVRIRSIAIRSSDLARQLDILLTCAVAGVLANRFFLVATGYPQVGNGTLHISHAIWGGLMMVTALVAAVAFIAPGVRRFVAVLGGLGFGWFVDELGKFITRKTNYFFRPTLALIYCLFIAMYLVFRTLERKRYRPDEALLNGIEALKWASVGALDESSRRHALHMLDETGSSDGLAPHVRELLHAVPTIAQPPPPRLTRLLYRMRGRYEGWTVRRGFVATLALLFLALAALDVGQVGILLVARSAIRTFPQWATVVSSLVSLTCAVVGVVLLRWARLAAYRWFEAGVLVSIFVTQVFLFADQQLAAVLDLFVALIVWIALRSAIRLELMARNVHESYRERRRATLGVDDPSLGEWDELPETLRASNRDQASHFADMLDAVGCGVIRQRGAPPFAFTQAEVEHLAHLEHDRWVAERQRQGWRPGAERDPTTKTTPYLVGWEALSEPVRDLDRDAVREIPDRLAQAGFAIVRLKAEGTEAKPD